MARIEAKFPSGRRLRLAQHLNIYLLVICAVFIRSLASSSTVVATVLYLITTECSSLGACSFVAAFALALRRRDFDTAAAITLWRLCSCSTAVALQTGRTRLANELQLLSSGTETAWLAASNQR